MSKTLTKNQILREVVTCGKDPVYFINNYCKISHPQKGLVPFDLYDYQEDLLNDYNDYRFNIILKARQLGISTVSAAYIVWLMLFYRDKNVLVVATKFATAANLVKKVKNIMTNLPKWLRISDIKIDNRTSFTLTNGSEVKASTTSGDAGRGEALSLLVIDEAAHIDGLDSLWTALYPTLTTGGRCIALSTPNGVGNWFHKTYAEADQGTNDFHPVKLPWDVHPERDRAWFEKETRNMIPRDIAQELECSFNASGETVIHPDDLNRMNESILQPMIKSAHDRSLWCWEEYDPEFTYYLVADVARGDGADYSAFHVIKANTMEQVAEYQGKPTLSNFASLIDKTGKLYGECLVVVENNSLGISVLEKLQEMEYPNLYYSVKATHEYINANEATHTNGVVPGFSTTSKTRPLIIAKLEEYIRNKLVNVYSSRLVGEFKTFVWKNNRAQAMRSYHDDLVITLAIACWVKDTALQVNQKEIDYSRAMFSSFQTSRKGFHTTIPGMEAHKKPVFSDETLQLRKEYDKFVWLLKG